MSIGPPHSQPAARRRFYAFTRHTLSIGPTSTRLPLLASQAVESAATALRIELESTPGAGSTITIWLPGS